MHRKVQKQAGAGAKNRFVGLDGLRGIAALAVLWYHFEVHVIHTGFVQHGYLAVDFFFVLSGFVISAAYERRLGVSLTLVDFFKARLIRLYPMLIVATALGVVLVLSKATNHILNVKSVAQQLLFIPAYRTNGMLYPLNNMQWSLFFELIANVIHVFAFRYMRVGWLFVLAALSAALLIALSIHGLSFNFGNGNSTLLGGLARVGLSYTVGIIIFRLYKAGLLSRIKGSWPSSLILLFIATCTPFPQNTPLAYAQDLLSVTILLPVALIMALDPRGSSFTNLWAERLGRLSYPLYIMQSPLLDLSYAAMAGFGGTVALGIKIGMLPIMVLIAWMLLVWFDEPVRARLTRFLHAPRQHVHAPRQHVAISAP